MKSENYSPSEIGLFAFALMLSFLLLLVGEPQEICAMPPFLAWLMLSRRG